MSEAWPGFEGQVDASDIEELAAIEEELTHRTAASSGYTSPLMSRLGSQRLTVELLATEVPKLRAAEEAAEALEKGIRGSRKQAAAREIVRAGEEAKERLFAAALPLIKTVANREHRRRQQWSSRVSLDDLTQDAIVGFFKGLAGFKPEAVRRSATNYLGQWMLVEMRRSAEVMDHDLQVGHDAGERFRRVRALRSRLLTDLGREPTDEEIAEASRNPAYLTRPGMVGRAPKDGESPSMGKGLTVAQVAEERAARTRVGPSARFATMEDDQPSGQGVVDAERLRVGRWDSSDPGAGDPAEMIAEAETARVVAALVAQVLVRLDMPGEQQEVIARRFALHPYEEEASAREISRVMGIHRERVTRILNAFTEEMTRKGGVFHEQVARLPEDDLVAVGLGWLVEALGPWDDSMRDPGGIPRILMETVVASAPAAERATGSTASGGFLAWYHCDYHDRVFSSLYPDKRSIPRFRDCPACHRRADIVRWQEQT